MSKDFKKWVSAFGLAQGQAAKPGPLNLASSGACEEQHGRQGFCGRISNLYYRHPPVGWTRIEGPARPRAYETLKVEGEEFYQPQKILANEDVSLGFVQFKDPACAFIRNTDGDEIRFVHQGKGKLETDYGDLAYSKGDFVVIPKGTTYRFLPHEPNSHLVIETKGEIQLPDRGPLGRHAPFDPMLLRAPVLSREEKKDGINADKEYEVRLKRHGEWSRIFYDWHPLNAIGWKGDLSPWAIQVEDTRPSMSNRSHYPMNATSTFMGEGFMIRTFVPRFFENEPNLLPVPFYQRNIDYDEVVFYHQGEGLLYDGIKPGHLTWHPQGMPTGPLPKATKQSENEQEIAIMLDTRKFLEASSQASRVEWLEFSDSRKRQKKS